MIGKLTGRIDSSGDDWAIVDVGGVGYLIYGSRRTLGGLPGRDEAVSLLIETHVREDHIHLFAFADRSERDWFRLLLTVQGVGTRHALAILSVLGPEELARSIAAQDKQALSRANGVGPKLASRIASELKDKAGAIALGPGAHAAAGTQAVNGAQAGPAPGGPAEDAVSALVNLGYRPAEALGAVASAQREVGAEAGVEVLIRVGLRELSS
ncbi:MAG: Holliday junction branch migration protein RuvA [Rhodovibrionaceae bacterium]|nr:Holliday junction branch migration protein RuvA [Rhodovibrionaceae bacterium]